MTVIEQPEVLVFNVEEASLSALIDGLKERFRLTSADSLAEALEHFKSATAPGLCLVGNDVSSIGFLLEAAGMLDQFPEAVLLLNDREEILWANELAQTLLQLAGPTPGRPLFEAWSEAEIVGPNFCPINMVLATGSQVKTTLRTSEKTFYELSVNPVPGSSSDEEPLLLITLRDTSEETLQQQKLNAIYQAGLDLGDLKPDEVLDLTVYDRIELLKSKILHYTQDLLEFETVEIRTIDHATQELKPLLAVGMDATAEQRVLRVSVEGNGVTGFVAASGRSYLCEDTEKDPLYLVGASGARSSLTVPLVLHDEVLGTFNVESPRPGAFSQTDLQFLELFCREVAIALNTLDLLVAEKATTAAESTKRMLCEVADPVDEILNDTSWIYEKFATRDPQVSERLRRILNNTQEIRELIRQAGMSIYAEAGKSFLPQHPYPHIAGKRLLVMDADREIRHSAHEILERFSVIVETARDGEQALRMARTFHYDVIISDIKPPDIKGSELYRRLREMHQHLPIILMTGFGWDGEHTIVKAREWGLKTVLYKPFILNQLLKAVEDAVSPPPA